MLMAGYLVECPPAIYKKAPAQHCHATQLQHVLPKMTSEPYNVQTDSRGCLEAHYIPLESITNTDMDGIAVATASES